MASWGSYVCELCRIGAYQGLTAEIDWNYTSWSRRCRKILIGLVVRGAKTVVVRGKNRILTRNRKKPEMTVPISHPFKCDLYPQVHFIEYFSCLILFCFTLTSFLYPFCL